tara:strand:+ start:394 stop:699 length:306 start_codon:yes stop_codon:yes gene_type:complete
MTIKDFMLSKEHIGQNVYEIEEERVIVIKTHVIAKDDDEAFNKYLNCDDYLISERHQCKDNGDDVVIDWVKDYGEYKGTKKIGTIKKTDDPEEFEMEVVYG